MFLYFVPCMAAGWSQLQKSLSSILLNSSRLCFQVALKFSGFHNQSVSFTYKETGDTRPRRNYSMRLRKTTEEDQEDTIMGCESWLLLKRLV